MLHLQKLGIRGIRSFDPEDFQEIKFKPLTLILGQNGAGKTTIIESLKFAATGELPPGCDRGKTFVHDIGLTTESTINGQIKLAFNDVENKKTVITRSIRTSARNVKGKQTVTFKQVNQVILRDGKSIDQKCCDINTEAIELFGVSKAVLNNVIFCHQEDTNWPLSEGKVLKEKFDTIFGSDEYVKSLDKIKKIRTEKVKNLKHITAETENAHDWMKEAKRIKKDLANEDSRIQELRKRTVKYKEDLEAYKVQLEELSKKEEIIDNHMKDILKIECSAKAVKYRIQELESFSLDKDLLSKGLEEILEQVNTYHQKNDQLIEERKMLEEKLDSLNSKNSQLSRERKTLAQELGKIDELKHQIELKKKYRNEVFADNKHFNDKFSKETLIEKQILSSEEKRFIEEAIKKEFQEFQNVCDSEKSIVQRQFDDVDAIIQKNRNRISVLFHQIKEKEQNLKDLENKIRNLGSIALDKKEAEAENELKKLSQEIQEYKDLISKLESEGNELKVNRNKFENQKKTLKVEINSLESKVSSLEAILESNNEAFMRKSIDDKVLQKNTIFDKCTLALESLQLDAKGLLFPSLKSEISRYDSEIKSFNTAIELNTKRRNEAVKGMDAHHDLIDELKKIKSSFVGVCDVDEFEKLKDSKEIAMKESYARKEYLSTIIPALEKQLDQVKCGGYCPVCENDIDSIWTSKKTGDSMEHSNVVDNLTKTIRDNTEELESFSTDALEIEIQRLKKLSPLHDRYQTLKAQVEESKNNFEIAKDRIEEYKKNISKNNDELQKAKRCLEKFEKFRFDVQLHDSLVSEIESLERQFKALDSSKHLKQLEDVKEELSEKRSLLSFVQNEIDRFASKLERNSDDKSNAFNSLRVAEEEERNLKQSQENKSSYLKFVSEKDQLKADITKLNLEHEKLSQTSPDDVSKSKDLKQKLENLNSKFQNEKLKLRNSLKTFSSFCNEIEECHKRLQNCYEKNSKGYIETLENDIKEVESEIPKVEKSLKNIKEELESSSPRLEMLIRCRDLLKFKDEESMYENQISEIRSKMPKESLTLVRSSKFSLSEDRTKIQAKLENTKTQTLECQDRAETLRERLEEKKFANAEMNYKRSMAEELVTKMACDDLNKYYKAMDSSITQFHITKMNEINKILEKLWKIAYQGKDIEAIKIVSDEDVRSADSARRNYDYRVVMVRNDKELDMRGRCSAGQKVLASLVIRLVLAIIFCNNFTVVTLDEPTTNLDRKNIRAFSRAIASLLKSDRFFQIIIITHDREFLDCLDSQLIDEYFEIAKNERGYSQITLKSTNEDANPLESSIPKPFEKAIDETKKKRKQDDVSLIQVKRAKTEHSQ